MFGKQRKETKTYGIIGMGRFGSSLTRELAKSGAEIIVLDRDEDKIRKARELTENAMVTNTLDKDVLRDTGIQNCDVVIVCIGSHMESSILTTLNLVAMGIPEVIAKATSPEHGEIDPLRAWCSMCAYTIRPAMRIQIRPGSLRP